MATNINNVSINNLIITSVEYMMASTRDTDQLSVFLDQLTQITISNSEEETDVTGKNGAILKKIKKNKGVEVKGQNAIWSGALLSAQVGSDPVVNNGTRVTRPDSIEIKGGIGRLSYTPVGVAGNEIGTLFVRSANGDIISQQKYTQSADIGKISNGSSPVFYYNKSDNTIQVPSSGEYGIDDGSIVIVKYEYETNATTITNYADIFGKTLDIWIYLSATDTCDRTYKCALHMPRGQFSGTFDIDVSGDQVAQDFTITNLIDTCNTTANNKLWDFIVFED